MYIGRMSYFQKGLVTVICILLAIIGIEMVYYQSLSRKVESNNSKLTQNSSSIQLNENDNKITNNIINGLSREITDSNNRSFLSSLSITTEITGVINDINLNKGKLKNMDYISRITLINDKGLKKYIYLTSYHMKIIEIFDRQQKQIKFAELRVGDEIKIVNKIDLLLSKILEYKIKKNSL